MLTARMSTALRATRSCPIAASRSSRVSRLWRGSNSSRLYSNVSIPSEGPEDDDPIYKPDATESEEHTSTTQPWYMDVVKDQYQETQFQVQELKFPANSPETLRFLATFLRDDLGLSEILIFDLRGSKDSHTTAVAKISDFIVMATARSGKHCHKSFIEVNALLKQKYQVLAHVEGNISANELRRRQRRLARHTNLSKSMGTRSAVTRSGAQTESWYMIDCHLDNIFVNILTENRREELNLEELYAPPQEKHLYRRDSDNSRDVTAADEEDDNVLAGLKRLAARNQKRFYSTVSSQKMLAESLSQQDFERAYDLVSSVHSLSVAKTVAAALEMMPVTTSLRVDDWLLIFNQVWSAKLAQLPEYWNLRFHFMKLLNCSTHSSFGIQGVLTNYLEFKMASGVIITRSDLVNFLELACINLEEGPSEYEDLATTNKAVVKALQLYKGVDPAFFMDEELMCLILRTMCSSRGSLKALNEMIDFVCTEYSSNITTSMITTVLQLLAENKEYMKILKFWENGIKIQGTQDHRPWAYFIHTLAKSEDQKFMRKVLNEGHLLWLKRNNINVSPQLQNALDDLFGAADPDNIAYADLKEFLIQD
ncbi:LADA_0G10286g1_1 [Lachancea dasiensis]|uniref:ATPase synthesis protein 25 n=1 Tax=Lachancea dasiensis TaxID=1072105 RepID=A0A1G4JUM3_9SACH|nr:LADA_0G10286g1_1 [Lachancea dasiensis]